MKITQDNYKKYFDTLNAEVEAIEGSGNKFAQDVVKKLRLELDGKLQGADDLMAENSVLKIGVVGQVKAGKSSFLNSLFFDGENVLPRASTPMTAGLTVLEYGDQDKFIVEYYNTKEWQGFEDKAKDYDSIVETYKQNYKQTNPDMPEAEVVKLAEKEIDMAIKTAKELVSNCNRNALLKIKDVALCEDKSFSGVNDLQDILEQFVGANGQFTSVVKCLTIQMRDDRLKDLRIVDTPGVNDPVVSREQRTREFLRSCHGVFFLSYSGHFFDSTDVDFLTNRIGSQGVGTVVLIASKFDSVLQDEGKRFENDLEGAINHCQRQLKSQYETNIKTSNFNGDDPILDFSSGIGFSIYKKDPSRWDDMERHVVGRMKVYYPDFFATDEDAKETFYNLSQMDSIREKYLEKVFLANKDRIISDKVAAYFGSMSSEMHKLAEQCKNDLSTKLEVLKSASIGDLEAKKESTEKAIKTVESGISSVTERLKSKAGLAETESLNAARFSAPRIPTQSVTKSFTRTSTFLGWNKVFSATYEEVDVNRLVEYLKSGAERAMQDMMDKWSKEVEGLTKFLMDNIGMMLTKAEQDDPTGQFDADILRNIMYEVVDSMSASAKLAYGEKINEFNDCCLDALQGIEVLHYEQKMFSNEDAGGREHVKSLASACVNDARRTVSQLVSSFNTTMSSMLNASKQEVVGIVTSWKQEFISEMNGKSREFIDDLKDQLADKKQNVEALESALQSLDNFNSKL